MPDDQLRLRTDKVEWRVVEEEIVALTLDSDRYLAVNETGALLWKALVEGATRPSLILLLEAEGGEAGGVARDLEGFLAALRARDLLSE